MEVKEFVKSILTQLDQAVDEARDVSVRDMTLRSGPDARTVEFDIAISVEEGSATGGKAGIKVLSFVEAGGAKSRVVTNSTISRVRFGVDIDSNTRAEKIEQKAKIRQVNRKNQTNFMVS